MIRKVILGVLLLVKITSLVGQNKVASIFDFDGCSMKDRLGNMTDAVPEFPPACLCGTDNDALNINLNSLELDNSIDSFFKSNFTICFDVFIENITGEVNILSKAFTCNSDTSIEISYRVRDSLFVIFLKEGTDEVYTLFAHSDPKSCWQNVCLTMNGIDIRAYVNGKEKANVVAVDLMRLDNGLPIRFNKSDCQNNGFRPLEGRLDRILIANYAFLREDIINHFLPQHRILTQDTIIFIGDQFELRSVSNCPSLISWTPSTFLSDPSILNPICSATTDVLYSTEFRLGRCVLRDSVLVRPVDISTLECKDIRLPSAFTPNGDNLNDEFYISNPYIINKLEYFDILDRNGGLIFSTTDPYMRWDGSFKNKVLNSGTYFYRVEYMCKNEVYKNRGTVTLMR
ncbi:MAG: T9SS type B sorting domain-containing protein [Saprospiraceae bacterium]|nr:T9SS type B sorting domain-containing protein [Saprospiraceae bacterium]